ncbi:hypothetical protein N9301_09585 [Paracoccaceae bacterium]|nr:hypothetical protein [Paracoccaceae bacterium]
MSEENLSDTDTVDQEASATDGEALGSEITDFNQNGLLLKIATDGIAIQDYVKRLKESDILVAVDGELYLDGPAKLNDKFVMEAGDEAKWLLTFWRDGQLFDILLRAPIQSQFGLATEQESEWALEQFSTHVYGDFDEYQNYEIYRDVRGVCDVLSLEKDPVAFILPSLWCLKYRLFPPLAAIVAAYLVTFFINIFLFLLTYIILSRFVYISQDNILRSFTLYAGKSHYMTIASTNENDVSAIVKKIDPKNKIRFEANAIKKSSVVHKVIVKGATTPGE